MKNPFEAASDIEREHLKKLAFKLNCNHILMPSKCKYDSLFEKNKKIYSVEAKVRACSSGRYDSAMIEKNKYDSLMSLVADYHCDEALYVFFFTDKKALVFDLRNIHPVWERMDLVKNTVRDNGTVSKTIYNIPFNLGRMIDL